MSLSLRLTLSYLAVILVGMGIAAPLAWLAVEQVYLDTQRANLLAQAQLVATALQASPEPALALPAYAQTTNALPGIHTWVIAEQNAVVVDVPAKGSGATAGGVVAPLPYLAQNSAGSVSPEELFSRPEIAQALAGQAATAIRRVNLPSTQRRVLYAAAPVLAPDSRVTRIVYVTSPLPDANWQALPPATRWQLAGALLLAFLLAGGAGWGLARGLARPLHQLAAAARAVAAGNLRQTVPDQSVTTELRALGQAFNQMTASLRQADEAKTVFVANVSHELRTPLTVIKGTIETLQDGALDDVEARTSFLNAMASETERLIRLVNDLLVLTRADAGVLNLQLQPVAIDEIARDRARRLAVIADRRNVQIQVVSSSSAAEAATAAPSDPLRLADSAPPALADPYRLAQVFDNLLENAIRYSPPGSHVTVSLTPAAAEWQCSVADTGSGIAAQHLPFIFDRFYRADVSRSRASGGSGLGLAITRALVLAQGGRISAQSREGAGTTVTFWLPFAQG
jgi:signal transduction histidine kinase